MFKTHTPVSTGMISNKCMICHSKLHMFSYNLSPPKMSKSKIVIWHFLDSNQANQPL